jgi:hypothetical protein
VDSRAPWQALQARLTNARAAVQDGDQARALAEISAALEIDPDFLAAQSLRDRILAASDIVAPPRIPAASTAASAPPANANSVSREGYAKFEQRARRRRTDRRLEAARAAIDSGRLRAAATALDEVIELDANLPELVELTARFDQLRRQTATTHRGPWLAATGVFAVMLLGASWLHDSTPLISRPILIPSRPMLIAATPLVSPPVPTLRVSPEVIADNTTAVREPEPEPDLPARVVLPPRVVEPVQPRASVETAAAMRAPAPIEMVELVPLPPPVATPPRQTGVVQESPVVAAVSAPSPPPAAAISDESLLVKQVLQQYRTAYEGLDAQSAHAVWPAVNQTALARAFDGLESQSLTFDACEVRVRGESAIAICQGSAKYVPKIGNRQPRTEPRVWNFSLRKAGSDWKIDSARAER